MPTALPSTAPGPSVAPLSLFETTQLFIGSGAAFRSRRGFAQRIGLIMEKEIGGGGRSGFYLSHSPDKIVSEEPLRK